MQPKFIPPTGIGDTAITIIINILGNGFLEFKRPQMSDFTNMVIHGFC